MNLENVDFSELMIKYLEDVLIQYRESKKLGKREEQNIVKFLDFCKSQWKED